MKKGILLMYLLVQMFYSASAQEQIAIDSMYDLSLEQLMNIEVTTASKVAEKTSDAPGIISTISAREIEQFGGISMVDLLERITGAVNMSSYIRPQNVTSFRGDLSGDNDIHTLILINGRPNRESIYGGWNSSVLLGIPLTSIDRIEVIRGPGSVLYGSNAYSAVVNIILKKGGDMMSKVSTYAGSFGGLGMDGTVGMSQGDLNVMIGFKKFQEAGWKMKVTDRANILDTANYGENNQGLTLMANYKGLTVSSLITESTQNVISSTGPIWQGVSDRVIYSKRSLTDIGYEVKYSDKASTKINATYNKFDLLFNNDATSYGKSDDVVLELTNFFNPADNFNIVVGGTYYKQSGIYMSAGNVAVPRYSNAWYNGYVQADYRPIDPLKLIAGIQINKIDGLDANVVPRFGAVYNFTEGLGAKVLYAEAFRAAYGFESGVDLGTFLKGNPNVKPETLKNLDAQIFYNKKKMELVLTYFTNKKEDNIIRSAGTFINSGVNKAHGLELEGKYVPNANIYVTGSYAYQTNESEAANGTFTQEASLMPNNVIKLGVSYKTKNGLSLGLFDMYVSKFNKFTGQDNLPNVNGDVDGFNTLSANFSIDIPRLFNLDIKEGVLLSLYGTNLLDQAISIPDYASKTVYSLPGRSGRALYASVAVKF